MPFDGVDKKLARVLRHRNLDRMGISRAFRSKDEAVVHSFGTPRRNGCGQRQPELVAISIKNSKPNVTGEWPT